MVPPKHETSCGEGTPQPSRSTHDARVESLRPMIEENFAPYAERSSIGFFGWHAQRSKLEQGGGTETKTEWPKQVRSRGLFWSVALPDDVTWSGKDGGG